MIAVSNISKRYGKTNILKDVSFEASPGECICITGKNGSGKTTLLRILSGAMEADSGEISFYGHVTGAGKKNRKDAFFRKYSGYVPQADPLMEELSVKDNLMLYGAGKWNMDSICSRYDLKDILNKKVSKLSGGMKRRLSLAVVLLKSPPLLILDEPTSALDMYYKKEIGKELEIHKKNGGIIIMVSHDIAEIEASSRVLNLEDGRLCT